jgi:hypothetical protein
MSLKSRLVERDLFLYMSHLIRVTLE